MDTYRFSWLNRIILTIMAVVGILVIFPIFLNFPSFNSDLFPLIPGTVLILLAISGWLSKIVINEDSLLVVKMNEFLLPSTSVIPWNSIKKVRRATTGFMAFALSRYGLPLDIEIEFQENSSSRKLHFSLKNFSKKEELLNKLSQKVGGRMEETPSQMIKTAQGSFLNFWSVYLIIILIMLLSLIITLVRF